jgi:hypothetical protein
MTILQVPHVDEFDRQNLEGQRIDGYIRSGDSDTVQSQDTALDERATKTTTGNMVKKAIPQANNHSSTNRVLKSVN